MNNLSPNITASHIRATPPTATKSPTYAIVIISMGAISITVTYAGIRKDKANNIKIKEKNNRVKNKLPVILLVKAAIIVYIMLVVSKNAMFYSLPTMKLINRNKVIPYQKAPIPNTNTSGSPQTDK